MKGRHRLELGPDLARIEGIARGTRQAHILALDASPDLLTGEVRVYGRPAGQ